MGLNYEIGRRLFASRDFLLRTRLPGLRHYPRGRVMEFDLLRLFPSDPSVIFDIGANVGQTALHFQKWFPQAEIHSFEPVPENYARLVEAVKHLPRVKTYPLACGQTAGEFAINLHDDSERHSLAPQSGGRTVAVQVTTVDAFCEETGLQQIDLLKSDTEGFEAEVLQGAGRMLAQGGIKAVYVEVGLNGQRHHTPFADVLAVLKTYEFTFSGFYEVFRCGDRREMVLFSNALFVKLP